MANYGSILGLVSAILESIGVVLMANHYTGMRGWQLPIVLISGLWRGSFSRKAAKLSELFEDNAVVSLQGLAFIALGFLIGAVPNLIRLFE